MDKQTGYKTKSILSFPLMADKECLGVVMALNKIGVDHFTPEDEAVITTPSCVFLPSEACAGVLSAHGHCNA